MSARIKVEIDKNDYEHVIKAMRNISGRSEEYIFAKATTETAKQGQRLLASRAGAVYENPYSARALSSSKVKKGTVSGGSSAEILADRSRPTIKDFVYTPQSTPGANQYRPYSVSVATLKGKSYTISRAFILAAGSGHVAVEYISSQGGQPNLKNRKRKYKRKTEQEHMRQVMGPSIHAMMANEKVLPVEEPNIARILHEQVLAQLAKALGG